MSEELQSVLAIIASKLGLPMESLWSYLVRQQIIEGWLSLVFTLLVSVVMYLFLPRLIRKFVSGVQNSTDKSFLWFIYGCFSICWGIAFSILTYCSIISICTPEASALKSLLQALNGK